MINLAVAIAAFVGGHVVISGTDIRDAAVRTVGLRPFLVLFSVLALAGLAWVSLSFRAAPYVALWSPPLAMRWLTFVLVAFGLWLVVGGVMARGRQLPTGIHAITRHPVMWGVAAWAFGHLVARGDLASLIMFGGFTALAVSGAASQERKQRRQALAGWDAFSAATSQIPFAALLTGRTKLGFVEIGWQAPLATLVLFVVLLIGHSDVVGLSPLPV